MRTILEHHKGKERFSEQSLLVKHVSVSLAARQHAIMPSDRVEQSLLIKFVHINSIMHAYQMRVIVAHAIKDKLSFGSLYIVNKLFFICISIIHPSFSSQPLKIFCPCPSFDKNNPEHSHDNETIAHETKCSLRSMLNVAVRKRCTRID